MVLNDIDIDGTKNLRHAFVGRKFVDDHCTYQLPHDEHCETHQPKLGKVIATWKGGVIPTDTGSRWSHRKSTGIEYISGM